MILLCADIGNTNVTIGIFKEKSLCLKFDIPSSILINDKRKTELILSKNFKKKKINKEGIYEAIACSVVPKATKNFKDILKKSFGLKCIEVGKDIKAPIKNRYHFPQQVGQDRLTNAVAAIHFYGKPLIVVDFGTCITFDCISAKGDYLGGLIMPGMDMVLDALYKKTALLPKVKFSRPKALIGRSTKESIKSGIYYGFLGACDFIINQMKGKLGEKTLVIGTGGYARDLTIKNKLINILNLNLTLQGLYLIYREK
jgi:type III pantothenate kinase